MSGIRWSPEEFVWSAPAAERDGRPLLVLLHGLGADERDLAGLSPHLPEQIVTVAVRAPLPYGSGFAWFDDTVTPERSAELARAGESAVREWIGSLSGHSSLGVLGFSQGAATAMALLRSRPNVVGGVDVVGVPDVVGGVDYAVQIAGFVSPVVASSSPSVSPRRHGARVPVFSAHGELDRVVPLHRAAALSSWLQEHTAVTERLYAGVAHGISAEMLADIAGFLRTHAL